MIREGTINIPFKFAAGGTGSRFLIALRDEQRILAARCPSCERVLCPAPPFCGHCGDETEPEPIDVGPAGTLQSWTQLDANRAYGLVKLDGAHTAILHRLVGDAGQWTTGQRVRARFAETRIGSIVDIEGFEPDEETS